MKRRETTIWVYADWESLNGPQLMGVLTAQQVRGKEVFSFEYDDSWMHLTNQFLFLDPHLGLYKGKQFLADDQINFGIFLDSSPDRWGRLLMRRKEARNALEEKREERILFETDYLLGVFDENRMGGLRFKLDGQGEFMHNQKQMSTPPFASIRELEYASLQLERDDVINDPAYNQWLSLLIDPGSSLGGARPKASVVDEKGNLWIAKFPSVNDQKNTGAWELALNQLAVNCGIDVPEARIQQYTSKHHTYLTKRFDRRQQSRIHFASAMTLLGFQDGADFKDGIGYLDLVGFIVQQSAAVKEDLEQLWRRVVFNMFVSNTDDHLRNHGFILTKQGWRLSPAYDMNPNEMGNGLTLNVSENINEQDLSLALSTAKHYQLNISEANKIISDMKKELAQWQAIAKKNGINKAEIEQTKRAFRLIV